MFKVVESKFSYRRSNIWSEQTNTKDLKTQCCYKKEISYKAVSSRKYDTDDVQIDRYMFKFLTKFYGISCYFSKTLTEVALKRNIYKWFY